MALSKIQAESMNLADTYAFSGTVSGVSPITVIDQWRVTTSFTGTALPLSVNLERADTYGAGSLGTAMTQSSGVFTFPSTGLWQVIFFSLHQSSANNNDAKVNCTIRVSTDSGSNYFAGVQTAVNTHNTSGAARGGTYSSYVLDVTNVSTHKVKFEVSPTDTSNTTTYGSTNNNFTGMTFIRLGDT